MQPPVAFSSWSPLAVTTCTFRLVFSASRRDPSSGAGRPAMASSPSMMRVTMEVGADGVAVITICNPPVNALHPTIFDGLSEKYGEAMARDDVRAVVLTGAAGKFCGGFDINMFARIHQTGNMSLLPDSVELVSHMMEEGRKPSVAAIQGLALGGGLELTMVCR